MEFGIETWSEDLIEELKPLVARHYQEVTLHKEHVPLDPDWTRYTKIAEAGALLVIGARENGILVGYCVFYISNMMHFQTTQCASSDAIYLAPEHRNGFAGIKLIKASEAVLKERGITKVIWHVKLVKDFRKILYRIGYEEEDVVLSRILKDT